MNPIVIKRYQGRGKYYNTNTSQYCSLKDIKAFVNAGYTVLVTDVLTRDDVTKETISIALNPEPFKKNGLKGKAMWAKMKDNMLETQTALAAEFGVTFEELADVCLSIFGHAIRNYLKPYELKSAVNTLGKTEIAKGIRRYQLRQRRAIEESMIPSGYLPEHIKRKPVNFNFMSSHTLEEI